jgi:hypothetical protein
MHDDLHDPFVDLLVLLEKLSPVLYGISAKLDRVLGDKVAAATTDPYTEGRWLDTAQACAIIECSRAVLCRWCAAWVEQKLPGVRYNRRTKKRAVYQIHEKLVEQWRREHGGGEGGAA